MNEKEAQIICAEHLNFETRRRISWIDVAKGLLIVLVVLGHATSNMLVKNFLSSFYMPCFFLLSGYVRSRKKSVVARLWAQTKSILLPYFGFSLLLIAVQFLRSKLTHSPYEILSAVESIFIPYSGRVGGTVYQLWFLPCLFLASFVFELLLHKNGLRIVGCGLWVFLVVFGLCNDCGSLLLATAVAVVYVGVGYLLKEKGIVIKRTGIFAVVSFALAVMAFGIQCLVLHKNLDFSSGYFGFFPLFFVGSIAGSGMLICIAMLIENNRLLEYVGRNSLLFYGFHYVVLSGVSFVVERYIKERILSESFAFVLTFVGTGAVVLLWQKAKNTLEKRKSNV